MWILPLTCRITLYIYIDTYARCGGGDGGGAVGCAIRLNDPSGFLGKVAEDLVDISTRREAVAAVLTEAMEDLGCDGPPLPLSYLRPLLFNLTSCIPTISLSSIFLHVVISNFFLFPNFPSF